MEHDRLLRTRFRVVNRQSFLYSFLGSPGRFLGEESSIGSVGHDTPEIGNACECRETFA